MANKRLSDKKTILIYTIGTLFIIMLFSFAFFMLYDLHLSDQLKAFIKQQELFLSLAKNDLQEKLNDVVNTPFVRFRMYQAKKMPPPYAVNFFSIPEITGVIVLGKEGESINGIVEETSWASQVDNQQIIQELFRDYQTSITSAEDFYICPITAFDNHQYLVVCYPVKDGDHQRYFFVTTDIQTVIFDIINPVKIGAYGSAMAMDNFGKVLYDVETGIIGQNVFELHQAYPEVLDLDQKMVENDSGDQSYQFLIRSTNELHRKFISWDSIHLGEQKIILAIATPEKDILGDLQRYEAIFSFLGISIILVEILFGVVIYRLHSRNLKHTAKKLYNDYIKQSRELIESEKKAVEANQAKTEFLATMSHELKTPLNAILGFSDILIEMEESEEKCDYLNLIKEAGDHLLSIVTDILNFSKIESGQYTIEIGETKIKQLLQSSANMFRKRMADKNLRFNLEIDDRIPDTILTDDLSLSQILNNLLSNAVKFTDKGTITLRAHLKEEQKQSVQIEFSVSDTGVGIAPEMKQRIFESFTQVDMSIRRKHGGTGLGLTISNNILKMFGSALQLESKLNKGSRFSFILTAEISHKK